MSSIDEDLCLDCGLCCDGSLFWAVPVEKDEVAPATLDRDGWLRQPCACFNGACTVYEQRPAACRAFDCRVLQTVQAGKRDHVWARAQIAGMRKVLAELDAALPGAERSLYRRAAEFLSQHQGRIDDPAFQRQYRRVLQSLAAYEKALTFFHVKGGRG
ncbi:YkgJ family cysteine cluster protein [Rhodobacteraceae bacterium NNCM2]|nr:YkgJ family cysteine cluster protein [Coraliihabitans acroporae]